MSDLCEETSLLRPVISHLCFCWYVAFQSALRKVAFVSSCLLVADSTSFMSWLELIVLAEMVNRFLLLLIFSLVTWSSVLFFSRPKSSAYWVVFLRWIIVYPFDQDSGSLQCLFSYCFQLWSCKGGWNFFNTELDWEKQNLLGWMYILIYIYSSILQWDRIFQKKTFFRIFSGLLEECFREKLISNRTSQDLKKPYSTIQWYMYVNFECDSSEHRSCTDVRVLWTCKIHLDLGWLYLCCDLFTSTSTEEESVRFKNRVGM